MLLLAALLSLAAPADGFLPMFTITSISHRDITQRAVLRKTAEVCRAIAAREGRFFSLTIDDNLTADKVLMACSSSKTSFLSTIKFHTALNSVAFSNGAVDLIHYFKPSHHVTDEHLEEGRQLIARGSAAVKASVRRSSFFAGRLTLGSILHPLQDFYSHSNWVELGRTFPYTALFQPDRPLLNLAGPYVPTCKSCIGQNCEDNILPEILQKGLLTTGYFASFWPSKPRGKCSHGGTFDLSSYRSPRGGINKDSIGASHGSLHFKAAALAVDATAELLEDIRMSVGDRNFLRLMGISQASVLCFVIDTTVSMAGDIAQVTRVAFDMIDHRRGTELEPPAYILVPFNDPGFGPVQTTTGADEFKASINRLTFGGGGDIPEMSLSGLLLALTAAPPYSEIFVFTDAPAKDVHLRGIIQALIESTKSTVTFMMTHSGRRWRRSVSRARKDDQLYSDLSGASGGLAINVEKSELHNAMSVIMDASDSAVVTVFQVEWRPRKASETFPFLVDGSLQNVVAYITGSPSLTFELIDPSSATQTSSQSSGPLGSVTTTGNLRRVSLRNHTGLWQVTVNSKDPYSVKVTGQSSIDFIFNLVEAFEGAHGDFTLKAGRALAGGNTTLAITVTGGDTVKVKEVMLWESSLQTRVDGELKSYGGGTYLVGFTRVPAGDYGVILVGEDSTGSMFHRYASTRLKTSSVSVTAAVNDTSIEPGSTITVPFTVATVSHGQIDTDATGTFLVQANNDQDFPSSSPDSLVIAPRGGGQASGVVTLTAPASAASGSDVTLTILVQNRATSDVNSATLRFSIIAEVQDIYRPVCRTISTSQCTGRSPCSSSTWAFTTSITDEGGSGIHTIEIHQGNGTLNTSTVTGSDGENVTVTYSASCCTETVVLAAVDGAGNVGTCVGQAVSNRAGLVFSVEPWMISKYFLWSSLVVSLLAI
ncbi:von Willebrand factor A domain-containing protein 7-like [Synchiropus splendidus]|uniref:von Willebrand factor A domain-containing protein 7-like n=1 Tax=Synchiropus splendidus TaxID=270530 RepID=UPI00237D7B73|nr:von Willebrand factor A domain-containing protein 7-like [Synchiropus splendidus]